MSKQLSYWYNMVQHGLAHATLSNSRHFLWASLAVPKRTSKCFPKKILHYITLDLTHTVYKPYTLTVGL